MRTMRLRPAQKDVVIQCNAAAKIVVGTLLESDLADFRDPAIFSVHKAQLVLSQAMLVNCTKKNWRNM